MSEFKFVAKCVAMTLVLVMILQLRVGPKTIEQHTLDAAHGTGISAPIQGVADAVTKFIRFGVSEAKSKISDKMVKQFDQGKKETTKHFDQFRASIEDGKKKIFKKDINAAGTSGSSSEVSLSNQKSKNLNSNANTERDILESSSHEDDDISLADTITNAFKGSKPAIGN
jgi:hypothetical protein